jgi:hypothetical protein
MERTFTPKERQALLFYLIIANVWTWALWIPPLLSAIRQGLVLPNPDNYARLAMSIPGGFDQHGLPIGLQFVGKPWDDLTVLQFANHYLKTTAGA